MANYIPLLRFKRGELTALSKLQQASKTGVFPYFDISTDRFRGRNATANTAAISPPNHVVQQITTSWGNGLCFVDASKVSQQTGASHPIEQIVNAAVSAGNNIAPATHLGAPQNYLKAVSKIHQNHHLDVCLKVDFQEFTTVQNWIQNWPVASQNTHLIVDLADNVAAVSALGLALSQAFQNLYAANQWLSVTVAGSALPENFSGYSQGTYHIDRTEWQIWQSLQTANLNYDIHYGDFATVAVTAPPTGIKWGFPINVRYTINDAFLICRGVKTTGPNAVDMGQQLIGHAQTIMAQPNRNRLATCWADDQIDAVANQSRGPGNLETWVGFGVNRHIALIRDLLP